jgi:hypothetical protein
MLRVAAQDMYFLTGQVLEILIQLAASIKINQPRRGSMVGAGTQDSKASCKDKGPDSGWALRDLNVNEIVKVLTFLLPRTTDNTNILTLVERIISHTGIQKLNDSVGHNLLPVILGNMTGHYELDLGKPSDRLAFIMMTEQNNSSIEQFKQQQKRPGRRGGVVLTTELLKSSTKSVFDSNGGFSVVLFSTQINYFLPFFNLTIPCVIRFFCTRHVSKR